MARSHIGVMEPTELVCCQGCLACLLAAGETAHAVPRLVADVVRGFPGRTVDVPISLRYRTNDVRDVVALQADVVFDATGVADADAEPAPGVITSNHVLASSAPFIGTRRLLVYSPAGSVLTNGEIASIPFNVGPNEYRNFTLRLTNVILVCADASQVFGETAHVAIAVNKVYVGPNGSADGFLDVTTNGIEQCFIVQATTDFQTWSNVQTNSAEGALLQFVDPSAGDYPQRFYRAIVCETLAGAAINAASVQVGTITQLPGGRVQFDFTGASGRSYVIQASTNLADWRDISTVTAAGGVVSYTNAAGPGSTYRFFRLKSVP